MRAAIVLLAIACRIPGYPALPPSKDGQTELTEARIAAARGRSQHAIMLYDTVRRFSPAWPYALHEGSRERLRVGQHAKALGQIMTLRSPQLAAWVFPESFAVEAEIYFRNCYFERVFAIANYFRAAILPMRDKLDRSDQLYLDIDLADLTLVRLEEVSREKLGFMVDADHMPPPPRSEPMVIDADDFALWQFDGEYWPDELGNYRVKLTSRCMPRSALLKR